MLKILADEAKRGEALVGSTATDIFERSLLRVCEREVPKLKIPWEPSRQLQLLGSIADLMNEEQAYELADSDSWLSLVVEGDVTGDQPAARRKEEILSRATQLKNHPLLSALTLSDNDAISFPHPLYRDYFLAARFKLASSTDTDLRNALRVGLPDGSLLFAAHMFDDQALAVVAGKALDWKEGVRDVWKIILARCDVCSKDQIHDRSKKLLACLGGRSQHDYQNLSGLNFRLIDFDSFSFVGANLTRASFQACVFRECGFQGSLLGGCRFYQCEADEETARGLQNLGVATVTVPRILRAAKVSVGTPEEDPVTELVTKFFKRFIRDERGKNQRTASVESFFSGLGGEERKFTDREILPAMLKANLMSRVGGVQVYQFNADWQADGDALIWDRHLSDKLKPLVDRLREKAGRYNLL